MNSIKYWHENCCLCFFGLEHEQLGSQLTENRRALVARFSSVRVSDLCLLAQVYNSLEFLKGNVFHVLAVYAFLALIDVDLHLAHLPFLESNVYGPVTKNILGAICHDVIKDFLEKSKIC